MDSTYFAKVEIDGALVRLFADEGRSDAAVRTFVEQESAPYIDALVVRILDDRRMQRGAFTP